MSLEVTFRTVNGGSFKLSVEPTDTILDVKKKIAEHQNLTQVDYASYRLIFKGAILDEAATVDSSGVAGAPSNFVVVMPPRKQPRPANPSITMKDDSKPSNAKDTEMKAEKSPPSKTNTADSSAPEDTAAAAAQSTAAGTATGDDSNSLVTGQAYEQSVRQICEMGFQEDQVKRALRAAYNNPDRAVEFLFNGIPENAAAEPAASAPSAPPTTQQTSPVTSADSALPPAREQGSTQRNTPFNMFEVPQGDVPSMAGSEANSLDFLRAVPQFNLMRRLIQTNPAVLPQIMERLESINPQLMSIIDANREDFMRLINEPVADSEEMSADVMNQFAQAMAGGASGLNQPQGNQVYVTEEEHQQIDRLTELASNLGIHRAQVLETWLACNRDEALAANFLVDHAEELVADQSSGDGGTEPNRNEES